MSNADTGTQELREALRNIIKAPMRSEFSTAGIVVGMWSSTMVEEKIGDLEALVNTRIEAARLQDNHDWDAETFKPIIVCKRCATTYQTRGNKPCKGKMARVALRKEVSK